MNPDDEKRRRTLQDAIIILVGTVILCFMLWMVFNQ